MSNTLKKDVHCTAVILAGGQGKRIGGKVAKQYLEIGEKPVLWYSLMAVQNSEYIDECILVVRPDDLDYVKTELLSKYFFTKITRIADAGRERYESVWSALVSLKGINWMALTEEKKEEVLSDPDGAKDLPTDYIFIHDGARPFLTEEILKRNFECVTEHGACVTAVNSRDTIKIAGEDGSVALTPDRASVRVIQTPQTFRADLIYEAYRKAIYNEEEGLTDDAMCVERTGLSKVYFAQGDVKNIKITLPEDLIYAEYLLK